MLATILLPSEYHGSVLEEILKRRGIEWCGDNYDYEKQCLLSNNTYDDDADIEEAVEVEEAVEGINGEEDFSSRYLEDGRIVMK